MLHQIDPFVWELANGWDIEILKDVGMEGTVPSIGFGNGSVLGEGPGERTVVVKINGTPAVFHAGCVNYALYGRLCKLANVSFNDAAKPVIEYKLAYHTIHGLSYRDFLIYYPEALAWVKYGYDGDTTELWKHTVHATVDPNNVASSEKFRWKCYAIRNTFQ
jgi:hypothetical protein